MISWLQTLVNGLQTAVINIGAIFRALLGLVLPVFSRSGDFQRLGSALRLLL